MLAKALAKESGATFSNIAASVLTNKWYGESNKLVAGIFSLARKAQPSIVFIDEIDSFLRERTKGDHEVTGMMKAEFMTCVLYSLLRSAPSLYVCPSVRLSVYLSFGGLGGLSVIQLMGRPDVEHRQDIGFGCDEPTK